MDKGSVYRPFIRHFFGEFKSAIFELPVPKSNCKRLILAATAASVGLPSVEPVEALETYDNVY